MQPSAGHSHDARSTPMPETTKPKHPSRPIVVLAAVALAVLLVALAFRWWDRAVAAGATITMPLADQFWGDRYGQLKDPFGHSWSIGAPVKA